METVVSVTKNKTRREKKIGYRRWGFLRKRPIDCFGHIPPFSLLLFHTILNVQNAWNLLKDCQICVILLHEETKDFIKILFFKQGILYSFYFTNRSVDSLLTWLKLESNRWRTCLSFVLYHKDDFYHLETKLDRGELKFLFKDARFLLYSKTFTSNKKFLQ